MKLVKHPNSFDFFVKISFQFRAFVITPFLSLPKICDHTSTRMGINIDLNAEIIAFFDSFRFTMTEWYKSHIAALALPDRTSSSSSCFPSLVNATPRYIFELLFLFH